MDDQPTCGQGLAANAPLPTAVGALMKAMADVLAVHQRALDPGDPQAQPEHEAYGRLVGELREVAERLATAAGRMTGSRDLPMGRHDEQVMAGRDAVAAFERFVQAEGTLHGLLGGVLGEHQAMLDQMRGL